MVQWIVFRNQNGKELCAYTVHSTFAGEMQATREMIAYENGIDPNSIRVTVEQRRG